MAQVLCPPAATTARIRTRHILLLCVMVLCCTSSPAILFALCYILFPLAGLFQMFTDPLQSLGGLLVAGNERHLTPAPTPQMLAFAAVTIESKNPGHNGDSDANRPLTTALIPAAAVSPSSSSGSGGRGKSLVVNQGPVDAGIRRLCGKQAKPLEELRRMIGNAYDERYQSIHKPVPVSEHSEDYYDEDIVGGDTTPAVTTGRNGRQGFYKDDHHQSPSSYGHRFPDHKAFFAPPGHRELIISGPYSDLLNMVKQDTRANTMLLPASGEQAGDGSSSIRVQQFHNSTGSLLDSPTTILSDSDEAGRRKSIGSTATASGRKSRRPWFLYNRHRHHKTTAGGNSTAGELPLPTTPSNISDISIAKPAVRSDASDPDASVDHLSFAAERRRHSLTTLTDVDDDELALSSDRLTELNQILRPLASKRNRSREDDEVITELHQKISYETNRLAIARSAGAATARYGSLSDSGVELRTLDGGRNYWPNININNNMNNSNRDSSDYNLDSSHTTGQKTATIRRRQLRKYYRSHRALPASPMSALGGARGSGRTGGTLASPSMRPPPPDATNATPWHCDEKVDWADLGPNHFPRYIRNVTCGETSNPKRLQSCFFDQATCQGKGLLMKVLRRLSEKDCILVQRKDLQKRGKSMEEIQKFMDSDEPIFDEPWVWEEIAVTTCCTCRLEHPKVPSTQRTRLFWK